MNERVGKHCLVVPVVVFAMAACATDPDDMGSFEVSPEAYMPMNCEQLAREQRFVDRRIEELHARLEAIRERDEWQAGTGVVFFPMLFLLEGDTPEEAEYMRLKGEREAIERVIDEKSCRLRSPPPSPDDR